MAYIWDLDGTLIDSYPGIMESLLNVLDYYHIKLEKDYVYNYIMQNSVSDFLSFISKEYSLDLDLVRKKNREFEIKTEKNVELISGALETLKGIKERGDLNFLYTHKGEATKDILKNLGIFEYFTLVLTSENSFKRKPDPEAINYIIDKYSLKRSDTYYVGDRPLDVLCAKNANINGILFLRSDSPIKMDYPNVINDLIDLLK